MENVDFGKTAADYARYRADFPDEFFDRLAKLLQPGARALDLGTGTGTLARGLARRGLSVVGLDKSKALIDAARGLDEAAGVHVFYLVAPAEDTGLATGSFDLVTAGQCWSWFDRPRAAREVRRLLAPGGYWVASHFDWIPLPGNVADATEQLIMQHNAEWRFGGGHGLHPEPLHDAAVAGFEDIETASFDLDQPYTHEAWRGRVRASAGIGASLPPAAVERFDRELARLLAARFPADPLPIRHRVFWMTCRRPAE